MNTPTPIQLLSPCGIALSMDAMVREAASRTTTVHPSSAQQVGSLSAWVLPNERAAIGEKDAPDFYHHDRYPNPDFYRS